MMKTLKVFTLLLVLSLPFGAHAEGGKDDDWFRGRLFTPELVLRNANSLKLSDAQRKTIRQEVVKVQTAVAAVDIEMMEEGLAIQDAIDKLPVDRTEVLQRADKVFAAESRKKRAWIEMLVNIKNALTPAQVEQLRALEGGGAKP